MRTRVMGWGHPLSPEEALIPTWNLSATKATETVAGETPEQQGHGAGVAYISPGEGGGD